MARKLDLRERARAALGDFDYSEEALREKMADLYEQDAKERGENDTGISLAKALIVRDGNLSALGQKAESPQKYEWGGEQFEINLPELVKHDEKQSPFECKLPVMPEDENQRRGSTTAKAKPKTLITPEKKRHFDELKAKEEKRAADAKAKPEEKRKQGRPKKHESGGQISIWFDDKMKAAVNQRAMVWHCSFSDAVNRLLMLAIKGHM